MQCFLLGDINSMFIFQGAAMGVKRGSIMVLIKPHPSYKDAFDEMFQEMKAMPIPVDRQDGLQLPQDKL